MNKQIIEVIKQYLPYVTAIGLLMVLCSLAFPYNDVQKKGLFVAGIGYVLDFILNQRWVGWKLSKDKWVFVACIAFFLLFPIWILLGIETGPRLNSYMETYLPFIILGIVGLIGVVPQVKVEWFATAALATISGITIYIAAEVGLTHMFENIHSSANPFNVSRCLHAISHMHFNLYANMGLVLAIAALQKKDLHIVWKIVLPILMAITITAVFISDGRAGLITMLLILGFAVLHLVWYRNKLVALGIAIVCSLVTGGIVVHSLQSHYASMEDEPRQYIWAVAINQIKDHPWLGYGPSAGHEEFVKRGVADENFMNKYGNQLRQLDPTYPGDLIEMAHPHNVFIETGIAYGVLGVILFVIIFLLPSLTNSPPYRFPLFLCTMTYFIQGIFEKMGCDLNPLLWLIVLVLLSRRIGDEPASDNA